MKQSTMRNLAPEESLWQEERHRLINSENFGEAASSFLQTGITNSSPKLTKQRKKKQKTELDLEIRAVRKRKRKLLNQLLKDKLAQITDDDKPSKKRNLIITIDDSADKRNVRVLKEELKSKEEGPANKSTNAEEDPKQTTISNQTEEYLEYVETYHKTVGEDEPVEPIQSSQTVREVEPIAVVEDDIIDRDTSQEEEEEVQRNLEKKATRANFKLSLPSLEFIQPELNPFIDLYLNYKEAHSQIPSADEANEALIQVASLGVDSLKELLGIVDDLWKESNKDTVMEKLVRQFPFIPLFPSFPYYHSLIVKVLSFELGRSMTDILSSNKSTSTDSATPSRTHTPKTAPLSPAYLEERTAEYFTLKDTSTQENTLTEASSISQENIITQETATTKAYTIQQENTLTEASTITQDNITTTQGYTITEADTITQANYSVEGSFKCSLCDLVLRTEAELKTHNLKPHRYNLLNKKFLSSDNPRIGQVNSPFLCPHCAELIPFNGRHKHMIAHQIANFKSQWENCQRADS